MGPHSASEYVSYRLAASRYPFLNVTVDAAQTTAMSTKGHIALTTAR